VLVDKPAGWTSFDVVRRVRPGVAGKVGHAGTLDPFATGLLLLLLGQATRVSSFLMDLPKEYAVTVQFGAVSTTGDPTGEITPTGGRTTIEEVVTALDGFRGVITQRVPMTSAVKVGGEALYRKAHRGEHIQTPERAVRVYDLVLTGFDAGAQQAELLATVSKGTYMRTLAENLGAAVGAGAYAAALRRRRVGSFAVEQAWSPDDLTPERLGSDAPGIYPLSEALAFLPAHCLPAPAAARAAHGNEVRGGPEGLFRAYGPDGLLGLFSGVAGLARPVVVFAPPEG